MGGQRGREDGRMGGWGGQGGREDRKAGRKEEKEGGRTGKGSQLLRIRLQLQLGPLPTMTSCFGPRIIDNIW